MKTLLPIGALGVVLVGAIVTAVLIFSNAPPGAPPPGTPTLDLGQGAFKILVHGDGFYQVSLAEFDEARVSATGTQAHEMHLSTGGRPVHYHIDDDTLIFYGRKSDSRYTDARPYILEFGRSGPQMDNVPVAAVASARAPSISQTLHLEQNLIYDSRARQPDSGASVADEPWFWATIQTGERLPIEFNLPELAGGSSRIHVRLWGATHNNQIDMDHDFELLVNDHPVETVRWDGEDYFASESTIPDGILRPGANTIVIDNSNQGAAPLDIFRLDWVDVEFGVRPVAQDGHLEFKDVGGEVQLSGFDDEPFLFEISDPDQPGILNGWDFCEGTVAVGITDNMHVVAISSDALLVPEEIRPLRPSDLASPDNQADLIIIAGDELQESLQPLIDTREDQGLTVSAVPLEEIYDEFGHGEASPDGIAAFLRFASEQWANPKPRYLLLVGEATYDYRGYLGGGPRNQVPPPLVPVSFGGETVSDGRLADVDGDGVPNLAVGRWPVSDPETVADLVRRTLAYESGTAQPKAIFAADGTSIEFSALSDRLIASSMLDIDNVDKLYGLPEAAFADAWSDGAWLVSYTGHGSLDRWGKDDVFSADGVIALRSTGSPPIVLQLTCLTGFFAHPTAISISEQMLLHPDGPVLLIGATSLTLSASQEPFGVRFVQELQNPDVTRIGDAFLRAKQSLDITNFRLLEVSDTFGLLGDPSTPILRPRPAERAG